MSRFFRLEWGDDYSSISSMWMSEVARIRAEICLDRKGNAMTCFTTIYYTVLPTVD